MKKGFTLIELLIVISILSIASVSCVISFNKIGSNTKEEETENIYKQVQSSAMIYMELNDYYIKEFTTKGVIYIPYMTLLSENYITKDINKKVDDDIKNSEVNKSNLFVKIKVETGNVKTSNDKEEYVEKEYVDTWIVIKESKGFKCFKNNNGKDC